MWLLTAIPIARCIDVVMMRHCVLQVASLIAGRDVGLLGEAGLYSSPVYQNIKPSTPPPTML